MSRLRQTLEFEVLCALDKPAQTVVRRFNVDCTCRTAQRPPAGASGLRRGPAARDPPPGRVMADEVYFWKQQVPTRHPDQLSADSTAARQWSALFVAGSASSVRWPPRAG